MLGGIMAFLVVVFLELELQIERLGFRFGVGRAQRRLRARSAEPGARIGRACCGTAESVAVRVALTSVALELVTRSVVGAWAFGGLRLSASDT